MEPFLLWCKYNILKPKDKMILSTISSQIPFMMGAISVFLLSFSEKQNIWLVSLYIAGFIGNELLNRILKPIIQDPRPVPISPTDKYGMPSGHSQLAAYSLVFITLTLREKQYGWIFLFIFMTIATMAQRVIARVHSLEQVIIGGLLGGGIGYFLQKFGSSIFVRK